jgi:hypothetical protein
VIAVQVADEDVIEFVNAQLIPPQLQLTSFTAVDEEVVMMDGEVL